MHFCTRSVLILAVCVAGASAQAQALRVLFETDQDVNPPTVEQTITTFASYNDLRNNTPSSSAVVRLNPNPNFSAAGLLYDGGTYRMLFETDTDTSPPGEISFLNFDSYARLVNGNDSSYNESSLDVSAAYSVAGIFKDGGIYRVLFETDADTEAPTELLFFAHVARCQPLAP
jgi:hypothetical protein